MKIPKLKEKIIYCILIVASVIIMYLLDIQCIFKTLFGIPCPGCGITRAYISLLNLDFRQAFEFNPMFWSVPVIFLLILFEGVPLGKKYVNDILYGIIGLGFLVTWIYRLVTL